MNVYELTTAAIPAVANLMCTIKPDWWDFVTEQDFKWAINEATKKKKNDFSKVEFLIYEEGLCVQCMHIGSYDDEPITVKLMEDYARENGYEINITDTKFHHEIYLSDPRRCETTKLKTVIRHPIKKI